MWHLWRRWLVGGATLRLNGPADSIGNLSASRRAMLAAMFPNARKQAPAAQEQPPALAGDRVDAGALPARAGMEPSQVSFGATTEPDPVPAQPEPPVQAAREQTGKHRQGSGERFPDAPPVADGEVFGPTTGSYKPKSARNASADKRETVEALQSVLIAQGFLPASPGADSHYGSRTAHAVGKWQRAFNQFVKKHAAELGVAAQAIRVDGVYGPETRGAMQQLNALLRDNPALAATFAELARKVMTAPAPRAAVPPPQEAPPEPPVVVPEAPPPIVATVSPAETVDLAVQPAPEPAPVVPDPGIATTAAAVIDVSVPVNLPLTLPIEVRPVGLSSSVVQPPPEPIVASPPSLPTTPPPMSATAPPASRMPLDDREAQALLSAIRSYPGVLGVEAGPARIAIEVAETASTHKLVFDLLRKRVVYLSGQGQQEAGEVELKDEGDRVEAYLKAANVSAMPRKLELGMLPGLLLTLRERLFDHQ